MRLNRRNLMKVSLAAPLAPMALPALAQSPEGAESPGPYGLEIATDFPFEKKRMAVLGSEMAYVDAGSGPPVVFLHGNPTSSYLWRNVIPHVTQAGFRAIAPDLIGMGDSGKPDIDYSFADHMDYLGALLARLDLSDVTLVVHDWGSGLGMKWARQTPERVARLAYMEAITPPFWPVADWADMPPPLAEFFQLMRSEQGAQMIYDQNFFVEGVLPQMGVMRPLQEAEMAAYRAPFATRASRKPTLAWPRQVPIAGTPADVVQDITLNGAWLTQSAIPKLLFYTEPGVIMPAPVVAWHIGNVPNLETRALGAGLHFVQEEHPHLIGQGLVDWLRRTPTA
jgi:haloalkane dehalogenase